jgi:uroporphyrinogen decarboxylase
MRQAGRYMPAYRALREKHSLFELFHRSDLATQVTLLPLTSLDVDAAIIFSDILVIVECLGLMLQFPESGGPRITPAVRNVQEADALPLLEVENILGYVLETIVRVKAQIKQPVIGFCGGPFTVATYCLDSWSGEPFSVTRQWLERDPEGLHRFLDKITRVTIAYVQAQIHAGADAIQVFDSWANILSVEQFHLFCLPYLQRIVKTLHVPVILFCRDSSQRADALAQLKPACISLDEHGDMAALRASLPSTIAIQGNFSPTLLKSPLSVIEMEVRRLLEPLRGEKGFIVNLGHGVPPDTPFPHVQHFVQIVKNFS